MIVLLPTLDDKTFDFVFAAKSFKNNDDSGLVKTFDELLFNSYGKKEKEFDRNWWEENFFQE